MRLNSIEPRCPAAPRDDVAKVHLFGSALAASTTCGMVVGGRRGFITSTSGPRAVRATGMKSATGS